MAKQSAGVPKSECATFAEVFARLAASQARIPVLSESVPMRRDAWGEPVERGNSLGPDVASPIYTTPMSNDPVRQEVARLRVPLSRPQRYITIDGTRANLTPQQYDDFVQLAGKPAKQYLDEFMGTPEWRSMNDGERREEVREVLSEFRAAGRVALLERYPELMGSDDEVPRLPPGASLLGAGRQPSAASVPPLPPGASLVQ